MFVIPEEIRVSHTGAIIHFALDIWHGVIYHYNTKANSRGDGTAMDLEFNDAQPIYRQLRDHVIAMILDGVLKEGDPLPSVRNVAAEYRVNPLTVLKGYQQLTDEQLVEKRRGLGMFIRDGARAQLLAGEREKFLIDEWPRIKSTIERLGLNTEDLLNGKKGRR